jgi:hypothetical protein
MSGQKQTAFFRVRFPDKGAGVTGYTGYVEGVDEDDVRERAADAGHLIVFDATKGKVRRTDMDDRDALLDALKKPGNPNEAFTTDGTVLWWDRDNGGLQESEP